jgi:hypothetical protein
MQIFCSSKTPIGLYARRHWLGENQTPQWRYDFNHTIKMLYKGQSARGCWSNSLIDTIRHLFHLHLTVREQTKAVRAGLDWLLNTTLDSPYKALDYTQEKYSIRDFRGLPFTPSHSGIVPKTVSIFLATVFGRDNDRRVLAACDVLDREGIKTAGHWRGWASLTNVLRAFVVHPTYTHSGSVLFAVNALATAQNLDGNWISSVPFYKTINALAHLNVPQADRQFERALVRLIRTQSHDGSWGKVEPEWSTFLVVHALKRKGIL